MNQYAVLFSGITTHIWSFIFAVTMLPTHFLTNTKKFNTRDGMGFALLKERGIITGIVTGKKTNIAERRAQKLQIDEIHQGVKNKLDVIVCLADEYHIALDEMAYVGDDINDIEVLEKVGFSCTVNDASENIKGKAKYVSKRNGGEGAVREIIDMILARNVKE